MKTEKKKEEEKGEGKGRAPYRTFRSLADLTLTLVIFELAISLILYFVMPYVAQHGGSLFGVALPGGGFQISGTPFQIHSLRFGAYLSAMPFYIGIPMLVLSFLTLGASFFSLRSGLITLAALGFLAVVFAGYSWMLSDILGGMAYSVAMLAGLVFALVAYSAQMRMTSPSSGKNGAPRF